MRLLIAPCVFWAPYMSLLKTYLSTMLPPPLPVVQGVWLSPRVVNLALQYLTVAVKAARTWKVLQPHVPQLMARVLFPLMCFDDSDAELWADDPQEYIRKVPPRTT